MGCYRQCHSSPIFDRARGKIGALLVFIAAGQEEPSTFHLQPSLSTGGVKYLHGATPAFSGSGEAASLGNEPRPRFPGNRLFEAISTGTGK
jgi:hypothetical protein